MNRHSRHSTIRTAGALASLLLLTALAPAAVPPIGEPAPALSVNELFNAPEGASMRWKDLEGKVVVVDFWATWCGPCIASIPHMNKLTEQFADDGTGAFMQLYDVSPQQVVITDDLPDEQLDFAITVPDDHEKRDYRRLIEAGLGAAFGVQARTEEREVDVLVISPAGPGSIAQSKLLTPTVSTGGSSSSGRTLPDGTRTFTLVNQPLSHVVSNVATTLDRIVIDNTGTDPVV